MVPGQGPGPKGRKTAPTGWISALRRGVGDPQVSLAEQVPGLLQGWAFAGRTVRLWVQPPASCARSKPAAETTASVLSLGGLGAAQGPAAGEGGTPKLTGTSGSHM